MASFQENVEKVTTLDKFPKDVLDLVISFLSLADVFSLRCVCKEWNEFITARALKENEQLRYKKIELLAVCNVDSGSIDSDSIDSGGDSPEFKAYDVEAEKWHSFDLSFLPEFASGLRVVDFSGGLACVMQNPSIETILYVCNPVTKRWALLPSSPTIFDSSSSSPDVIIVRIYYCANTGHYKVFVVSGFGANSIAFDRLVVEEFDSSSWSWAVHSQTCHPFRWSDVTGVGVLPCNNGNDASLYILLYKTFSHNRDEGQLFALLFDEEKGDLLLVNIRAPLPTTSFNPTLVCCDQSPRPLLVSVVKDEERTSAIEIWELGNELIEWRNLATMPHDTFRYFKILHREADVERRKLAGRMIRMFIMSERGVLRFNEFLSPMMVVAVVADKHLLYIHPESMVTWTIAYDTITRSWLRLSTKFPPRFNATQFSSTTTALSCIHERAFEPSLENVVSRLEPSLENAVSHMDIDG